MDDKYFLSQHISRAGNDQFYSSDKENVTNNVKYYGKTKIWKTKSRLIFWIAISLKGILQLLSAFTPSTAISMKNFELSGLSNLFQTLRSFN